MLSLLEREVSFVEASRMLAPKRLLLVEGGVRSEMICHANMLTTIDNDKQCR
jgi:hypothetical protein